MSLIKKSQKEYLYNEASKYALINYDLVLLGDYLEDLFEDPTYKDKLKLAQPLTKSYLAIPGAEISTNSIKLLVEGLYRDLEVLKMSVKEIDKVSTNFLNANSIEIQLVKRLASYVKQQAEGEKNRLAEKANWAFVETFNTTANVNLNTTTAVIDTGEGLVYPSGLDSEIQLHLVSEEILDVGGGLKSTAGAMLDKSQKTAWIVYCTTPNVAARAKFRLDHSDVSGITVDPVGFGTKVNLIIETKGGTQEISDIIFTTTTFRVNILGVKNITVEISSPSTTLPKATGIREIKVLGNKSQLEGKLYTNEFTVNTFNEIRLNPIQQVPPNTKINWFWSYDEFNWSELPINQWVPVTDQGSILEEIDATTLTPDGVLYLPPAFSFTPFNYSTGRLEVGVGQFEVTAEKKNMFIQGITQYVPDPTTFKPGLKTWTDSSVSVTTNTSSAVQSDLQLYNTSEDDTYFQAGQGLVGNMSDSLVWLPISGSRPSFQKNYHYRFSTNVFCKEDVLVNTGRYWFLQGFKAANTKTFKESRFSLGSFSMWVNGVAICGDTLPDTLYDDGSADTAAINGHGFTFVLKKGWNKIEYHFYRPDIPSYLKDPDLIEEFLQIVIYPNIFDSAFQDANGIVKVIGTGEVPSISQFDLVWKQPKSLDKWAWSEFNSNSIVFNTNKTHKIDGFYGGTLPQSYPKLNLYYKSASSISDISLYLRADLEKASESDARPTISGYEVLIR